MSQPDQVVRAMTDDGAFRVIAARTTETANGIVRAQQANGAIAQQLAELVTASIVYRETMAPKLRVQCVVEDEKAGKLIADSHPDGWARGLVHKSEEGELPRFEGEGVLLQMMRTLPSGDLHRGVVQLPSGGNLSDAFMRYMQQSEQIVSMVSLGATLDKAQPVVGGYLLQLLPEAKESKAAMAIMTERLNEFRDITQLLQRTNASPKALIEEILFGMPFTWLHDSELRPGCNCSDVRVMTSLSTLPREDIEEMIRDGNPLELSCDYCGAEYVVDPTRLTGLLATS